MFNYIKRYFSFFNKQNKKFVLPFEPFGEGDTERCVEIPWAISCFQKQKTVLDVGYGNAENRYIQELLSLNIPELFGIDLVHRNVPGITSILGDIRKTSFIDNYFDLVFCISTIEHIGRDNSSNPLPYEGEFFEDFEGDFQALKELYRIVKPKGKVIITVPFGSFFNYGWFVHYDEKRLQNLLKSTDFKVLLEDYYIYKAGWYNCNKSELKNILYQDNSAPAAAGLACILLQKL
jgi:O-antigen chain-terminating methyltransferase